MRGKLILGLAMNFLTGGASFEFFNMFETD